MMIFTMISILFLPPGIVGGIFGMNVRVPWQADAHNSHWPFTVLCVVMVASIAVMFVIFNRYKSRM